MPPENETDIFGDPQQEPDFSTEGLQWEADDTFDDIAPEADGEAPLPSGEEDAVTNPEAEAEGGDDGAEDSADEGEDNGDDPAEPGAENADEFVVPEHLKALLDKSPEELVKVIVDSQSMVTKQANEIGDLRKSVEAIQQAQQQASQQEQVELAPAGDYIHDEQDGILAYREAIGMLDRGEIGPKAIDDIIDVVREISPFTAAKMDRDFGMRLARAEMNAQMAPVIQQSYNDALRQATVQLNTDPDAEAYREDIVRIVQQPQSLLEHQVSVAYQQARTAPDIQGALAAALQIARGANPIKGSAFKANMEAKKQNEAVETGNSSPAPKRKTEEERIIDSFLQPADPGADLFAGFGGGR